MLTGPMLIDGELYNLTSSGSLSKMAGWLKGDEWDYYFQANGKAAKGWYKVGTKWYYFKPYNFFMASNETLVIDGVTYIFNRNGTYTKG